MRLLTHDERNAVDAASDGRPLNPQWSADARLLYDAIVRAMWTERSACSSELVGEAIIWC
jgi:hypothetical protein